MSSFNDDFLFNVLKKLPTDYKDYGGKIDRWGSHAEDYLPDCSSCKFHVALEPPFSADWGVCTNPHAKRAGMLTFEHQAGAKCHSSITPPKKRKRKKKNEQKD